MRIGLPIAAYEQGTTGEYLKRAFVTLGHEAEILSQWQFYTAIKENQHDLYMCVDSGGALNLFESGLAHIDFSRLGFWMIDYRRGKELKNPNDAATCRYVNEKGGWIFQSQKEDYAECLTIGLERSMWLPLAADTDVWSDKPEEQKNYQIGFVGNVWDGARQSVLNEIGSRFNLLFKGHGGARMEEGAQVLRQCKIGFNISSFYGEPVAFDANMRVFETLACGVPLVTNYVESLADLGLLYQPFVKVYRSRQEIIDKISEGLRDEAFLNSGQQARAWILENATYVHRARTILSAFGAQ